MSNKINIREHKGKRCITYQAYFCHENQTYWTPCFESYEVAFHAGIAKCKKVMGRLAGNVFIGESFACFLDYFLSDYSAKRKESWANDASNIRLYVKPRLGHLVTDEIRLSDINDFAMWLRTQPTCHGLDEAEIRRLRRKKWSLSKIARHLSLSRDTVSKYLHRDCPKLKGTTINRILSLLHKAFQQAKVLGVVAKNPVNGVEKEPEADVEIEFWMPNDVSRFLAAAVNSIYFDYYLYLLNTGCRPSEPFGLMFDDIRPGLQNLSVRRQWDYHDGVFKQLKTKKSRSIPVNAVVRKIILRKKPHIVVQNHRFRDLRKQFVDLKGALVFHNGSGQALDYYTVFRDFSRVCKEAGVTNIGLYGLRHTYATNFIMVAQDRWLELKKNLGHQSFETTQRYIHLVEEFLSEKEPVVNFDFPVSSDLIGEE